MRIMILTLLIASMFFIPANAKEAKHHQPTLEKWKIGTSKLPKAKCLNPDHYNEKGQHYFIPGESRFGDGHVLK